VSCTGSRACAPQPRLEHEGDLIQWPGALVVGWNKEQHSLLAPIPRGVAQRLEALSEIEHRVGCPDRRRMLGEAGNLLRAHTGAGGDHDLVVGKLVPVLERGLLAFRVDISDRAALQRDPATPERLGELDKEVLGIGAERDVDRVRPKQEPVTVGDDRNLEGLVCSQPQQKGRLQRREATTEDQNARLVGHLLRLLTVGMAQRPPWGLAGSSESGLTTGWAPWLASSPRACLGRAPVVPAPTRHTLASTRRSGRTASQTRDA
jgi:hypothetical protein